MARYRIPPRSRRVAASGPRRAALAAAGIALLAAFAPAAAAAPLPPASGPASGGALITVPGTAVIAGGGESAYLLGDDGIVYAWGAGNWGQLGDGRLADGSGAQAPAPVAAGLANVPPGVRFTQVTAGEFTGYALGDDGVAYSWGADFHGQLGDNDPQQEARPTPAPVVMPAGVLFTQLSASGESAYALGDDGRVYAWGANAEGQLGDGTTTDRLVPTPVALPAGMRFTSLAAGGHSAYALAADGAVYAWGANAWGQLGNGATDDASTPVAAVRGEAPAGVGFTQLAAGDRSAYALGDDGNVYAWGFNFDGELGTTTALFSATSTPVVVQPGAKPAGVRFVHVVAGMYTAYGLGDDGHVYAWGDNLNGQVGDGTTDDAHAPVLVLPGAAPSGVRLVQVAAANEAGYALGDDGNVYAWGYGFYGQLGNEDDEDSAAPVAVAMPAGVTAPLWTVTGVSVGNVAATQLIELGGGAWQVSVPPAAAGGCGTVDVTVDARRAGASMTRTIADGFTYQWCPPSITSVQPGSGSALVSFAGGAAFDDADGKHWFVDSYIVTATPVGGGSPVAAQRSSLAGTDFPLEGLVNGVSYTVAVTAVYLTRDADLPTVQATSAASDPFMPQGLTVQSVDDQGNDADTPQDAAGIAPGTSRPVVITVTNSWNAPLFDVDVYLGVDPVGSAAALDLACTFPGQSGSTPGVFLPDDEAWSVDWLATFEAGSPGWAVGSSFTCTATVTMPSTVDAFGAPVFIGGDVAAIARTGASVSTDLAPAGSVEDAQWTGPYSSDQYWAVPAAISVSNADAATGAEADTAATAITYPAGAAQTVRWMVTNTGLVPLVDITLDDVTANGPPVGAWTCDLSAVGGSAGEDFAQPWPGPLAPGASFACLAPLALAPGDQHTDAVTATAAFLIPVPGIEGDADDTPSTVRISAANPFNAVVPDAAVPDEPVPAAPGQLPAGATTEPPAALAATGSPVSLLAAGGGAIGALIVGFALLAVRRQARGISRPRR